MKYIGFKLNAVVDHDGECTPDYNIKFQSELDNANANENGQFFWTVYGILSDNTVQAIADFGNLEDAKEIRDLLALGLEAINERD